MANPIIPLIMCGGAGTRLWPASRENRPKQFLPLFGSYSTFQETIRRVSDPALFGRPIIVTNGQYRFLVAEQLAAIGAQADILLEPMRRDSGPAIVAGQRIRPPPRSRTPSWSRWPPITSSPMPGAFAKVCAAAAQAAADNRIVTFGVRPTRAATEYGYIRAGAAHRRRYFCYRALRRETGCRNRAALCRRRAICGIPATFCSAPNCCSKNTARSSRTARPRSVSAVEAAGNDLGFRDARSRRHLRAPRRNRSITR